MKALIMWLFDALFESIKTHSVLAEYVHQNLVIQNYLKEFNDRIGGSRMVIHLYHNGGFYASGVSMQKSSCAYEVLQPGISSIIRESQNVLISENTNFHSSLIKQGFVHFASSKECLQISLRAALENRGVESYFAFSIKNIQNENIGYLALDFVNEPEALTLEQIEEVQEVCNTLAGYLTSPVKQQESKLYLTNAAAILIFLLAIAQVLDILVRFRTFFGF